MVTLQEIQERLKQTIIQSGLTQKVIAEKLGISQQTVSAYLNRNKMPALDTFANLCIALDVDANEILGVTK